MKDLSKFLSETKTDTKKSRPLKEGEGADDQDYIDLMSDYKQMRRYDTKRANKILEEAKELAKGGDVSKKAKMAVAYM